MGTADADGCFPNTFYGVSEFDLMTLVNNYVSDAGTTANAGETSLDEIEDTYTNNNVDYVDMGNNFNKFPSNLVLFSRRMTLIRSLILVTFDTVPFIFLKKTTPVCFD